MQTNRIITASAALVAAAGLAFGAASIASADESGTTSPSTTQSQTGEAQQGRGMGNGNTDPSKPMRSDEQLLTGDALAKVTAAVEAKEPDATIERVETDSDGVYEAHMDRADGTRITVQVGADFTVTNVQEGGQNGSGAPCDDDATQERTEQGETATPSVTG